MLPGFEAVEISIKAIRRKSDGLVAIQFWDLPTPNGEKVLMSSFFVYPEGSQNPTVSIEPPDDFDGLFIDCRSTSGK